MTLTCPHCAKPLDGHVIEADGKIYHLDCYRDAQVKRCWYDHEPLTGRYGIDPWGNPYCLKHDQEWPRCFYCGRFVTYLARGTGELDHRARCGICARVAVTSNEAAREKMPPLWTWLRRRQVTLPHRVTIHASLANEDDVLATAPGEEKPVGVTVSPGAGATPDTVRIRLRYGMPSPYFESVAIHEMGHAWLRLLGANGLPKRMEEGFCELLAHRWLRDQGTIDADFYARDKEQNGHPIYGDGFRRLDALASQVGFETIIVSLKTRLCLPTVA